MTTRRQLTLFASAADTKVIEAVRQKYNPVQFGLIRGHVTLCREAEIEHWEIIVKHLASLQHPPVTIAFALVETFSEGSGVWLPSFGENRAFHALRAQLLVGTNFQIEGIHPHLTLMHPRNSTCSPTIFQEIKGYSLPSELTFREVCLIEQTDGQAWQILRSFPLVAAN